MCVDDTMAINLARRAHNFEASVVRDLFTVGERPGMRSLAGGLPDPLAFPVERLHAAVDAVLGPRSRAARALQYGPTEGLTELRALLASTPVVQRVAGTAEDDFVVTAGSQQALHLLSTVLVDAGDTVVVDDPCYLGARQVLTAVGARLVGVLVDGDGLRVDILAERLRAGLRPRFVYTVPAYQNPSGAVLDAQRRAALIVLARRYGFVVIEDDAYGALGFENRGTAPVPLGTDAPDVTVTVGTVSKVLAPGLRVGWLRAPDAVRAAVVRTKQAVDLHTSTFTQSMVAELLADTVFLEGHLASLRERYAARSTALAAAFTVDGASFARPRGGLFLWVRLRGVDTAQLVEDALKHDVMFVPGSAFAVEHSWREYARLSFATLPESTLRTCATELVRLARLS
jgi:2-aminoadipate transaminase